MNYGIMSTSSIAPRFIAAVRQLGKDKILAVSSRTIEKAWKKATEWNVSRAYGSHRELLEDKDVDIVYISSVNAQHYPMAKAALEMGKHVLCEKPCTMSADQTRELFALAREKGLFFMEAQKMLFLPAVLEAKRRIEAGQLGQMHMAQLNHSFSAGYNTWQFDKASGGGTLLSSGIYAVELLQWLFGPVKTVSGAKSALPDGTEWQYIFSGETESGVLFSVHNSTRVMLDNTARLYGTKGYVEIPEYWKACKAVFHMEGKEPETVEFPCQHELVYEAAHVHKCIAQGRLTSPVVTEELSVSGIAALETIKSGWEKT